MKKFLITKSQLERAKKLFDFKELNNSITKGEGNLAGAVGEIIVKDVYQGSGENTYDYDTIIKDYKIDIKTKKFSDQFHPNSNWNLNVSDYNTKQKCDAYCFVGVNESNTVAYVYGFIKKKDFYDKAVFGKKGQIDPRGNGKWKFKSDCYNILIKDLLM